MSPFSFNFCFLVTLFLWVEFLYLKVVHYKCRFGHLACFTSDVEMFLQVLTHNEKTEILEDIMKVHESPSILPAKALGQVMTSFRLQESTGVTFRLPAFGILLAFDLIYDLKLVLSAVVYANSHVAVNKSFHCYLFSVEY